MAPHPYLDAEFVPELFNLEHREPSDVLRLDVEVFHKLLVLELTVVYRRQWVDVLVGGGAGMSACGTGFNLQQTVTRPTIKAIPTLRTNSQQSITTLTLHK